MPMERNPSYWDFFNKPKARYLTLAGAGLCIWSILILTWTFPLWPLERVGALAPYTLRADYSFDYVPARLEVNEARTQIEATTPSFYNPVLDTRSNFILRARARLQALQRQVTPQDVASLQLNEREAVQIKGYRTLLPQQLASIVAVYDRFSQNFFIVDTYPSSANAVPAVFVFPNSNMRVSLERILVPPIDPKVFQVLLQEYYPYMRSDMRNILAKVASSLIQPVAYIDADRKQQDIQNQLNRLFPKRRFQKGDLLMESGKEVTPSQLQALHVYRQTHVKLFLRHLPFLLLFTLMLYIGDIVFLYQMGDKGFRFPRNQIITLTHLLFANLGYACVYLVQQFVPFPAFVLLPFAALSLSLGELLRRSQSILVILLLTSLFYLVYPLANLFTLSNMILLSFVTIFASPMLSNRQGFFKVGLLISLVQLLVSILYLVQYPEPWLVTIQICITALVYGPACSLFALGFLPIAERIFNIPTRLRLLELSNPTTNDLLIQLKSKAPGTYNHSLLVGDMSGEAVQAIGLDGLLTRVGGYYHDIGKMENPEIFVENQMGNKNIHDSIAPMVSVAAIKSHVKIGVDLAEKAKLPEEIIDYILEHHGTTTIAYFYHQSISNFGEERVNKLDYQYNGPIPHTKGSAILSLADTIEATTRAYSQHSKEFTLHTIQEIVEETIARRIDEQQLIHCDLTLADLDIVKKVFTRFLHAYYHKRIEYKTVSGQAQHQRR